MPASLEARFQASQEEIDQRVENILSGKKLEQKEPPIIRRMHYTEDDQQKEIVTYRIVGEPDPEPEPEPPPPPRIKGFTQIERDKMVEDLHRVGIKTMDHPDVISRGMFRRTYR